jgi:hypothetical protein
MNKGSVKHPLSMFEFWRMWLEQLPECGNVKDAYEAAERAAVEMFGRRKFSSYGSFRKAKCIFLKKRPYKNA